MNADGVDIKYLAPDGSLQVLPSLMPMPSHPPFRSWRVGAERTRQLGRLMIMALAVIVLGLSVRAIRREAALPPGLHGVWVTDDPRYAGRALELTAGSVTFHSGGGQNMPHPVRKARAKIVEGGAASWEIVYQDGGRRSLLKVELMRSGVLVLERPSNVVWRRER